MTEQELIEALMRRGFETHIDDLAEGVDGKKCVSVWTRCLNLPGADIFVSVYQSGGADPTARLCSVSLDHRGVGLTRRRFKIGDWEGVLTRVDRLLKAHGEAEEARVQAETSAKAAAREEEVR